MGSAIFTVEEVAGNDDEVWLVRHEFPADPIHVDRVDCVAPVDIADDADFEPFERGREVFDWDG